MLPHLSQISHKLPYLQFWKVLSNKMSLNKQTNNQCTLFWLRQTAAIKRVFKEKEIKLSSGYHCRWNTMLYMSDMYYVMCHKDQHLDNLFIYWFILCLLLLSACSDYVTSNEDIWWIINLKGYGRKWLWPNITYPSVFLKRTRRNHKSLRKSRWSAGQYQNLKELLKWRKFAKHSIMMFQKLVIS